MVDSPLEEPYQDDAACVVADEGARDWRAEFLREVAQSRKYRQRAQKAEAELAELGERALFPEQHEEYQRLRQAAAGMADKDARIEALEGMVRRVVGANELSKALVAYGVAASPGGNRALAHAARLLEDRVEVDLSGESPVVRVLDELGRPMCRGDEADEEPGEPISLEEFVAHWLTEEGAHFLPASGDTGSGAYKGSATAAGVSIEYLDKDPGRKAQFIATYGPQAYVQLARRKRK
jgi:hypothetical protein